MSRLNIDIEALSDARFAVLANHVDGIVDADHARGKMERVWFQCLTQGTYELDPEAVLCAMGLPLCDEVNVVDGLLRSKLAKQTDAGLWICGTKGRIEWLEERRKAGAKGGKESGKTRKRNKEAKAKHAGSTASFLLRSKPQAQTNPPAPAPAPAPAPRSPNGDRTPTSADWFDRFWELYPRKVDKAAARRKFGSLVVSKEKFDRVCAAAGEMGRLWQQDPRSEFIPYPATWLNKRRWEEDAQIGPNGKTAEPRKRASEVDAELEALP